jgi:hypothetical protein
MTSPVIKPRALYVWFRLTSLRYSKAATRLAEDQSDVLHFEKRKAYDGWKTLKSQ